MEEKKIIVKTADLAMIHNMLMQVHLSGEDMINVSKCILTLRQIVETAEEYKEEVTEE